MGVGCEVVYVCAVRFSMAVIALSSDGESDSSSLWLSCGGLLEELSWLVFSLLGCGVLDEGCVGVAVMVVRLDCGCQYPSGL